MLYQKARKNAAIYRLRARHLAEGDKIRKFQVVRIRVNTAEAGTQSDFWS